jgi:hypothetical protein
MGTLNEYLHTVGSTTVNTTTWQPNFVPKPFHFCVTILYTRSRLYSLQVRSEVEAVVDDLHITI